MESVGDKGTEESVIRTKTRGLICREIEKDGMLKGLGGRKKGEMFWIHTASSAWSMRHREDGAGGEQEGTRMHEELSRLFWSRYFYHSGLFLTLKSKHKNKGTDFLKKSGRVFLVVTEQLPEKPPSCLSHLLRWRRSQAAHRLPCGAVPRSARVMRGTSCDCLLQCEGCPIFPVKVLAVFPRV